MTETIPSIEQTIIEHECVASICAAAARLAIQTNWRGTQPTALDEFSYWVNRELRLDNRARAPAQGGKRLSHFQPISRQLETTR